MKFIKIHLPLSLRSMFALSLLALIHLGLRAQSTHPISQLVERIAPGRSADFIFETIEDTSQDIFELSSREGKIVVRGNNYVSMATGLHHYLKYYAHRHLSWENMQISLPKRLPVVSHIERRSTRQVDRYYLNYCTFSYSMAFWDWSRWEREIDWMALHGINLPLVATGTDVVWRNVLRSLAYPEDAINKFITGPGFSAWWLMNNLEGWGGPNSQAWYEHSEALTKRILERMRQLGMRPVLPGYAGMMPSDSGTRLGIPTVGTGMWCGYSRPSFLLPTDSNFSRIAQLYYSEQAKLYGKADYYSMDPFHEGGSSKGVDLAQASRAILEAMQATAPQAKWVIQAWQENPRAEILSAIERGKLLVLDLWAESAPQWQGKQSGGYSKALEFRGHEWLYCMLLNFGGNVGLHGKIDALLKGYDLARKSSPLMRGIGLTMEGIENNPMMYELMCELPWMQTIPSRQAWVEQYARARYGVQDSILNSSLQTLAETIYNCPEGNYQQGTHESVFCARPSLSARSASTWAGSQDYYDARTVISASKLFASQRHRYGKSNTYHYDLIDFLRQGISERGRIAYERMVQAYNAKDYKGTEHNGELFLSLLMLQDQLLGLREEFTLAKWVNQARSLGSNTAEADHYEWNARVQISTWGAEQAANAGGLHDYAHKEWNGVLSTLYYQRWHRFIHSELLPSLEGEVRGASARDYYQMEEEWSQQRTPAQPKMSKRTKSKALEHILQSLEGIDQTLGLQ